VLSLRYATSLAIAIAYNYKVKQMPLNIRGTAYKPIPLYTFLDTSITITNYKPYLLSITTGVV
jgi:hypothetical protein